MSLYAFNLNPCEILGILYQSVNSVAPVYRTIHDHLTSTQRQTQLNSLADHTSPENVRIL